VERWRKGLVRWGGAGTAEGIVRVAGGVSGWESRGWREGGSNIERKRGGEGGGVGEGGGG